MDYKLIHKKLTVFKKTILSEIPPPAWTQVRDTEQNKKRFLDFYISEGRVEAEKVLSKQRVIFMKKRVTKRENSELRG